MRRGGFERWMAGAAAVAAVSFAVWIVGGLVLAWRTPEPPGPGAPAMAFTLTSIDGTSVQMRDYEGQVVLLEFWISDCVGCLGATRRLNRLHSEYGSQGFSVVSVNEDQGQPEQVRAVVETRQVKYPVLLDPGTVAAYYGVTGFPHSVLIGRDGIVRAVHSSLVSEARLRREVERVLSEG